MHVKKTIPISVELINNTNNDLRNVALLDINDTIFNRYYTNNEVSRQIIGDVETLNKISVNENDGELLILSDLSIYSTNMSQAYQQIYLIKKPHYIQEQYTTISPKLNPNDDDGNTYFLELSFNLGLSFSDVLLKNLISNSSVKISFNISLFTQKKNND